MRVEVAVDKPLLPGFWWRNSQGLEKWATIKYERLSDFCYECGILGHTTLACKEDIKQSETNSIAPAYGPWLVGIRPKQTTLKGRPMGESSHRTPGNTKGDKKTWFDVMKEAESAKKSRKATRSTNPQNQAETTQKGKGPKSMLLWKLKLREATTPRIIRREVVYKMLGLISILHQVKQL